MSQFPPALDFLLGFEDAARTYAAVTDNNGGEVIAGVNSKSYPSDFALINAAFQPDRAPLVANFYQQRFWTPLQLGGIQSQDLANRVLAAAVNTGPQMAIKILQRAVNQIHPLITVDGLMGPNTLEEVNAIPDDSMLAAFRQQLLARYQAVAAANPADAAYLGTAENPGPWWRRAIA